MGTLEQSFVVVDCETTGFHPSGHHRIVELALLRVNAGQLEDAWCSLLRPDRDLGPTAVHGVRGRDLLDAPSFEEVLGEVLDRLAGRIVVAHNARFDCAFLEAELERAGVDVGPLPALCTMELAQRLGRSGTRARLSDCCAAEGIEHGREHCAAADAAACAGLLATYLRVLAAEGAGGLAGLGCPEPRPAEHWPRSDRRAAARGRAAREATGPEPSFLSELAKGVGGPLGSDATTVVPYLDVLDRALEDRRLSESEQADLAAMARTLGLSAERVRSVHADYVSTLIALAYRDGVVTEREREDLDLVASALGVEGVETALQRLTDSHPIGDGAPDPAGLAGTSVCFTGELVCAYEGSPITRSLAQSLAEEAGLVVAPRVTKSLDLLVVADPDSMSGKTRKARDYGTRVVAETAFWPMIGVEVS